MRRTTVLGLGAAYIFVLLLVVFSPIGGQLNELTVRLYVFWTYTLHLRGMLPEDFGNILNVLMFVPLGALMVRLARWPWWVATLAAVGASMSIELVQVIPALHRVASVEDVVTNGLGGFLGAGIAATWSRRRPQVEDVPVSSVADVGTRPQ